MAESGVFLRKKVIRSKAFQELTKTEIRVFLEFLLKRTFERQGNKPGKNTRYSIRNNGEITFTYAEATKLLNIAPQTFQRAIDKLIKVGFVDITKQGHGGIIEHGKITGEATLYAIYDRWEDYGTENFKELVRTKDGRKGRGWSAYHAKKNRAKTIGSGKD